MENNKVPQAYDKHGNKLDFAIYDTDVVVGEASPVAALSPLTNFEEIKKFFSTSTYHRVECNDECVHFIDLGMTVTKMGVEAKLEITDNVSLDVVALVVGILSTTNKNGLYIGRNPQ